MWLKLHSYIALVLQYCVYQMRSKRKYKNKVRGMALDGIQEEPQVE